MVLNYRNRNDETLYKNNKSNILAFLYTTSFGSIFLKLLTKPFISKVGGLFLSTKISKYKIKSFISKNNINIKEYEDKEYKSFNDFFTRKIKKNNRKIGTDFISPCDSKLLVYKIKTDSTFCIKNHFYKINELVKKDISNEYKNGYCLIFRLECNDYHRYCYIDDCTKEDNIYIQGCLHTVQDIATDKYNIYKENSREYTVLHTKNYNDVIQIEVGALMVGKINNFHSFGSFKKGEEKGMFEFGGSTIVLLVKNNSINIDEDIVTNSENNIETKVKYGENIGKKT